MRKEYTSPEWMIVKMHDKDICTLSRLDSNEFENDDQWWLEFEDSENWWD